MTPGLKLLSGGPLRVSEPGMPVEHEFTLESSPNPNLFPVPTLRATKANTPLALDLVPNGSPSGTVKTWVDICSLDDRLGGGTAAARIEARAASVGFGSLNFGATPLDTWLFAKSNGNSATTPPQICLLVDGPIQTNKAVQPLIVALTDAATIAVNSDLANDFKVTLTDAVGATRAFGAPTGTPRGGQELAFRIKQSATGNRGATWNAIYRFSTDRPAPTLSNAAGTEDYVFFKYNADAVKWDCVDIVKGFA